jgi:hypothetical protein
LAFAASGEESPMHYEMHHKKGERSHVEYHIR